MLKARSKHIANERGALHLGAAIFAVISIWSTVVLLEDRLHIENLNMIVQNQAERLEMMELRVKVMQLRH
jgi:hypothetical protein